MSASQGAWGSSDNPWYSAGSPARPRCTECTAASTPLRSSGRVATLNHDMKHYLDSTRLSLHLLFRLLSSLLASFDTLKQGGLDTARNNRAHVQLHIVQDRVGRHVMQHCIPSLMIGRQLDVLDLKNRRSDEGRNAAQSTVERAKTLERQREEVIGEVRRDRAVVQKIWEGLFCLFAELAVQRNGLLISRDTRGGEGRQTRLQLIAHQHHDAFEKNLASTVHLALRRAQLLQLLLDARDLVKGSVHEQMAKLDVLERGIRVRYASREIVVQARVEHGESVDAMRATNHQLHGSLHSLLHSRTCGEKRHRSKRGSVDVLRTHRTLHVLRILLTQIKQNAPETENVSAVRRTRNRIWHQADRTAIILLNTALK